MPLESHFAGIYNETSDAIGPFILHNPPKKGDIIPQTAKDSLIESDGLFRWGDENEAHALVFRSGTELNQKTASKSPNLKVGYRSGVGIEKITKDIVNQGILYANCCPHSPEGVSNLVMHYIDLIVTRHRESQEFFANGKVGDPFKKLSPLDPTKLEIVLFGHGAIGTVVKRKLELKYPGINVAVRDPDPANRVLSNTKVYSSHLEAVVNADLMIFCVPGEAGCLLGSPEADHVREGARIINVSRENTVDLSTVRTLAETKNVQFAIDVLPGETGEQFFTDDILFLANHPNCIALSTHIGGSMPGIDSGNAIETVRRAQKFAKSGSFNEDNRRELPFQGFKPNDFSDYQAGTRLIMLIQCSQTDTIRGVVGNIASKINVDARLIGAISSRVSAAVNLVVVDITSDDLNPNPGQAMRFIEELPSSIKTLNHLISCYGAKEVEDEDETYGLGGA